MEIIILTGCLMIIPLTCTMQYELEFWPVMLQAAPGTLGSIGLLFLVGDEMGKNAFFNRFSFSLLFIGLLVVASLALWLIPMPNNREGFIYGLLHNLGLFIKVTFLLSMLLFCSPAIPFVHDRACLSGNQRWALLYRVFAMSICALFISIVYFWGVGFLTSGLFHGPPSDGELVICFKIALYGIRIVQPIWTKRYGLLMWFYYLERPIEYF